MKKYCPLTIALLALSLSFLSCSGGKDNPTSPPGPSFIAVTGISLDRTTITNDVTKQEKITATVQPENATNKAVTWTTSDDTRARVDETGLVTIIGSGKSVITATTRDSNKVAQCEVNGIGPDVYIGMDGAIGARGLYKNGFLQSQYKVDISAVFVSGDDVYAVAMRHYEGQGYWKNGEQHPHAGRAVVIFVSGDDVYTGGHEFVDGAADKGKLWKSGVEQPLDSYNDYPPYSVTSIAVLNDDVYAVGTVLTYFEEHDYGYRTDYDHVLWKNGKVILGGDNHPQHVFVSGNDIYRQDFPANFLVFEIFVLGNDVYIIGVELDEQRSGIPFLWKNGIKQETSYSVKSVYVK